MANLRTNNLSGEGGRNAYRGSVYFDGRDDVTVLQVIAEDGNSDFTFGTGDFTIEFWVYQSRRETTASLYGGRRDADDEVAPVIYLNSGVVTYYTAGSNRITGDSAIALNSWYHIVVERSSGSTKLYVNGVQEGSTYSDSNSYVAKLNRPTIGAEGRVFGNNPLVGYISNLRVCKGHAVYGAAFTPPTSELVSHYNTDDDKTVLLCCQDSDNPLQEATGKELLGQGGVYYGKRFSNLATNGDLETGTTTNWVNGGCDTFEVSNFSHSGSYSLHAVTNSNGDAVAYVIPFTLDTQRRYKISAYIYVAGPLGTSARAKMKIGSGTGGNENYESEVVGQGNNGLGNWKYVEWIGLPTSDTTHITFNESGSNNVNDYYVDDLRIELWYPEEGVNILGNPRFTSNSTGGATGWSFNSGNSPSTEWTIASNKLAVTDTSRTNDAIASQQLFDQPIKEGRYLLTIDYSVTSGDFDIGIGNGRLFGIANTYNGGAGANATFTAFLDANDGNSLFRIVANQHCVADFHSVHLSRVPEPKAVKNIPPSGVDAGNIFNGAISMNSSSWMYMPTGATDERGRGRAVTFGGYDSSANHEITFFDISTGGTSLRFGELGISQGYSGGAAASSTRAVYGGGIAPSPYNGVDITYVTIATEGNSIDFGANRNGSGLGRYAPGCGNKTRGIFISSQNYPAYYANTDFVTIASTGTCTDFGDNTNSRYGGAASASPTRAVYSGGVVGATSPGTNTISYATIATTGSWADFGDLSNGSGGYRYSNGSSSATRGLIYGGNFPGDGAEIDYITIATLGDSVDFGDAVVSGTHRGGFSNSIRGGAIGGFVSPGNHNTIEYVNIASTGNGIDFGDQHATRGYNMGTTSDSHGGL